jgi:hypothetical protein
MKILMTFLAIVALGLTIIPSMLVFGGKIESDMHKNLMTVGTILWFIAAPIWFRKKTKSG